MSTITTTTPANAKRQEKFKMSADNVLAFDYPFAPTLKEELIRLGKDSDKVIYSAYIDAVTVTVQNKVRALVEKSIDPATGLLKAGAEAEIATALQAWLPGVTAPRAAKAPKDPLAAGTAAVNAMSAEELDKFLAAVKARKQALGQ